MNKKTGNSVYAVYDWMVKDKRIKGVTRAVFAVIYDETVNGTGWYKGTLRDCAGLIGSTQVGVGRALKKLLSYGLIEKKEVEVINVKCCHYRSIALVDKNN